MFSLLVSMKNDRSDDTHLKKKGGGGGRGGGPREFKKCPPQWLGDEKFFQICKL